MKKFEKPTVKVVQFESMDVITTSGEVEGVTIQQLTTAQGNNSILFTD